MQLPWGSLLLALCLGHASASRFLSDVYNYMTNSNPTLLPTMVKEYEQDLWEPEPVEEYIQLAQVVHPPVAASRIPNYDLSRQSRA